MPPTAQSLYDALSRIEIFRDDITTLEVDAVVNAANERLAGGGGVDGAIHRAAGPELAAACRALGSCPTGRAVVTPGFRLPARWIIHTVGPVWRGGDAGEAELLASCYRESLRLARERALRSVAFPAISTGVYGYPVERAARVAIGTVAAVLAEHALPERVQLVLFSETDLEIYRRTRARMTEAA